MPNFLASNVHYGFCLFHVSSFVLNLSKFSHIDFDAWLFFILLCDPPESPKINSRGAARWKFLLWKWHNHIALWFPLASLGFFCAGALQEEHCNDRTVFQWHLFSWGLRKTIYGALPAALDGTTAWFTRRNSKAKMLSPPPLLIAIQNNLNWIHLGNCPNDKKLTRSR